MKTKIFSETFWKQFQTAVLANNKKDVVKLSYFLSEDDKEYFLETYRDTFDETSIEAISSAKYSTLKPINKNTKSPGIGPFELLILPESMNTVYVLNVAYSGATSVEDDYYSEDLEDENYDDFERESDFGRDSEFALDSDKFDDMDYGGDEIVEMIKSFAFGEIKGEFKFLGTYSLD